MSSDATPDHITFEAVLVFLLMVAATLWYAWPQLVFSLYPLYEIWRSVSP
jgi:hypothetical protein